MSPTNNTTTTMTWEQAAVFPRVKAVSQHVDRRQVITKIFFNAIFVGLLITMSAVIGKAAPKGVGRILGLTIFSSGAAILLANLINTIVKACKTKKMIAKDEAAVDATGRGRPELAKLLVKQTEDFGLSCAANSFQATSDQSALQQINDTLESDM